MASLDRNSPSIITLAGLAVVLVFLYFAFELLLQSEYTQAMRFINTNTCFNSSWDADLYPLGRHVYPYLQINASTHTIQQINSAGNIKELNISEVFGYEK